MRARIETALDRLHYAAVALFCVSMLGYMCLQGYADITDQTPPQWAENTAILGAFGGLLIMFLGFLGLLALEFLAMLRDALAFVRQSLAGRGDRVAHSNDFY